MSFHAERENENDGRQSEANQTRMVRTTLIVITWATSPTARSRAPPS